MNSINELTKQLSFIAESLQKDTWDYLGIIAPILLSIVAILISMWNSFWSRNIKNLEANMVWEEVRATFFIIIRNTGKKTLVIKSVSLMAYDKENQEEYELGTRDNAWSIRQEKGYIAENEMMVLSPIYGSIYDVFAYKGHAFSVTKNNEDLMVNIIVTDIDGKRWTFKTSFTLGEIDQKLCYAVTSSGL